MKKNRMGRGNRSRSKGVKTSIRQVWAWNFYYEISKLDACLQSHPILSIDTEFPGCIRSTPWGSIDEQLYEDLRFNVNQTKLIQLGLTASDLSGKVGGSWEFNFSDFDLEFDSHNPSSISFLKQNGLDFDKLKKDGIPLSVFATNFVGVLQKNRIFRWITFHGLYDIGYLVKAMGLVEDLPESMEEFAEIVVRKVGIVRDLKHMARFCEELEDGKLGLERLGQLLGQKRFGMKHHAGSDSLLTASVYVKMAQRYHLNPEICDNHLYGFSKNLQCMAATMLHQTIMFGQISFSIPVVWSRLSI